MNKKVTGKPVQILLVEDNPGDVRLTKEALRDAKMIVNLDVVGDGVEAMAFLRREGKYAKAQHPDLILLDLNMPKKDGREVLAEVKQDPDLRRTPVVIMTISDSEVDILKSYNLHANAYVSKPLGLQEFAKIIESVEDFWFTVVKLPPDGK